MGDDVAQLLERYRFPGMQSRVMPAYDGRSIMNLVSSLLANYGVHFGTPLAFHQEFAAAIRGRRKTIFLILDGLGWYNLEHALQCCPDIGELSTHGAVWPLTSVFPSTTSAALTTFLTGVTPAEHGVLGYLMYFPQYGKVFNMLGFQTPDEQRESLFDYGFVPEQYLAHPSTLERLYGAGNMVGAYTYQQYAGSGLSRLLYHDHLPHPYLALGDMLELALSQVAADVPQFLILYWSSLDSIAHVHGGMSAAYAMELRMLTSVILRLILPRLDGDTALVVCADHGHIDGDDGEAINLVHLPGVPNNLRLPPSGEGRVTYLFVRPGAEEEVRASLEATGVATVMHKEEYLAMGLLGPSLRPELEGSVGDLIVFPHGTRRTLYPYTRRIHTAMAGRHGGPSPEEMLVPLLVFT